MSQKRKKKRMLDRITCQIKSNSGPVNNIKTDAAQRIKNAIISRVLCFKIGSGS
tara:strand:- start:210 stop:371 length:162 start_codon:yes stop_codon:yes gene_type:complete